MISLRVCTLLYRGINICIVFIFMQSTELTWRAFITPGGEGLRYISNNNVWHLAETRRVLHQVNACVTKIVNILGLFNIYYF